MASSAAGVGSGSEGFGSTCFGGSVAVEVTGPEKDGGSMAGLAVGINFCEVGVEILDDD